MDDNMVNNSTSCNVQLIALGEARLAFHGGGTCLAILTGKAHSAFKLSKGDDNPDHFNSYPRPSAGIGGVLANRGGATSDPGLDITALLIIVTAVPSVVQHAHAPRGVTAGVGQGRDREDETNNVCH